MQNKLLIKFLKKTNNLEQYPMLGRVVPEVENPNIRELIHKNYRVIYTIISDNRIDIIAIHNSLRPLNEESIID